MRWGEPITTTVRGQGRLLGSKLAWVFQSRRRITIFVLVVVIIASSASYGLVTLNNKNAFRAAEDDSSEELAGLDYVEYITQDLFVQGLAPIPPEQLPDYDKVAITTELAGDLYFRISTVAERQEYLRNWDTSPEWRQFATQAESGEGGAWQWLGWVEPYCGGGELAKTPDLVPVAQAQSTPICNLLLTELQTKKVVNAGEFPGLAVFETDWKQFWHRASEKCIAGGVPTAKCWGIARYSKSYYQSSDLDRVYNTYWKDLKHLRTKNMFGSEEAARLKKIDKYFRLKLQNKVDEAIGELGNQYFNIGLALVPVGRLAQGLTWTTKGVSKVLGGMFDVAAKAPLGTAVRTTQVATAKAALLTARAAERIKIVTSGPLAGLKVNVSRMFARSKLRVPTSSNPASIVDAFVDSWSSAMNKMAADKEVYDAVFITREGLNTRFKDLANKSYVLSGRQMAQIMTGDARLNHGQICTAYACATKKTGETFYNEEMITFYAQFYHRNNEQVVIHEMSHHLSSWGQTERYRKFYSSRFGYNPIEEGAVDSTADYLAIKFGYSPAHWSVYKEEKVWFNEVVKAIDRGKKLGKIKTKENGRQLSMSYLYNHGLDRLDEVLVPGWPPGQQGSVIEESFRLFNANSPDHAILLVKALYK